MEDGQFDDEVNNLIEWCEDLDYDKYMENWHTLATSSKPEVPADDNAVHVYQAGLGDITIGLGAPSSVTSGPNYISTQPPAIIPSTGSPAAGGPGTTGPLQQPANPFKSQKVEEDMFLKSNLEYEQRLKEHLYQFDDPREEND